MLFVLTSLNARLGETIEELDERYGEPKKEARGSLHGDSVIIKVYELHGFEIEVVLKDRDKLIAGRLMYTKLNGEKLDRPELETIVEANLGKDYRLGVDGEYTATSDLGIAEISKDGTKVLFRDHKFIKNKKNHKKENMEDF